MKQSVQLFVLILFTCTSLIFAKEFTKEYHEQFPVSKGMTLNLKSGDGDVTIESWDKDEVQVDIVYRADHQGRSESERSFEVDFDLTSRTLHIIGEERTGSRYGITSRHIYQYTYDIKAPAYLMLDADGDDGNMKISGWRSDIECTLDDGDLVLKDIECAETYLKIADGDLTIENIKSDIAIWADDGDVDISGIEAERCQLEIKDGSCVIDDATGSYKIRFDDGDVKLSRVNANMIDVRGKDGRIELDLINSVNPDIILQTDDGPIRLRLNPDISAELSIETDDGDFSINLSNESRAREKKKWYQSTLNKGDGDITIRTNDGSVKVREL
jgi:DUF4097 and DUF4098 domain-containing protein YvlB